MSENVPLKFTNWPIDNKQLVSAVLSGTSTLGIAAVTKTIIRVYALFVSVATATTIEFEDGSTGLSGAMTLASGIPLVLPFNGYPYFVTSAGNAFNVVPGGSVQTSGTIYYTLDPPTLQY